MAKPQRVAIEWQNQFGRWQHYQHKYNEAEAFRTASRLAKQRNKRFRIIQEDSGILLDMIDP